MPGTSRKNSVNWLLHGVITVSVGIHVLVFLHIAGIYDSRTLTFIELTLEQIPYTRTIPAPRIREHPPLPVAQPHEVMPPVIPEAVKLTDITVPNLDMAPPEEPPAVIPAEVPVARPVEAPAKTAAAPAITKAPPARVSAAPVVKPAAFASAREYLILLNQRIQDFKQYPSLARSQHLQGVVRIQFVLQADGTIRNIEILRSSRHRSLDDAAVDAIRRAEPFPAPPADLLKSPVTLKVTIQFELT